MTAERASLEWLENPEVFQVNREKAHSDHLFYEKEEETHMYLPDYGKYDRNQMRKMTHLEYFKLADTYILFDYQNRNPLNQEARVCKVELIK